MNIEYDGFTSAPRTSAMSRPYQKIFKQFYEQGDIYKSSYEGRYCAECESFWTPAAQGGQPLPGLRPPHRDGARGELR